MDAAIFPTMLSLSQLPVSPPPDHKLFFNNHCPSQQPPAAVLANPLLMKSFAREMEGPTVKKAPSLLEKHYSKRVCTTAPSPAQIHKSHQQQQQQQPFTAQRQPVTPTSSVTPSSGSASCSADTKVPSSSHEPDHKQDLKTEPVQSPPPPPTPSQEQQQQQQQTQNSPQPPHPTFPPPGNPFLHLADPTTGALPTDPKYVQMVSRMAAYYQQRCQAILNFQQQRCQTWATSHRQKCQEMMQAAMLVVAWYIRDRIGRRRRRNKRAFRRGLREKNSAAVTGRRAPKGEAVRRWVLGIPDDAVPPPPPPPVVAAPGVTTGGGGPISPAAALFSSLANNNSNNSNNNNNDSSNNQDAMLLDAEERAFDVDKEVVPDKDSQLFAVADQMIKAQLAKIDVPLLGALNLDDSDSETEDEEEEDDDDDGGYDGGYGGKNYYYGPEDYDMEGKEGGEGEYDDDDDDDDLDYYEDEEDMEEGEGEGEEEGYVEDEASKEAMHGTGKGSLKRKRSESTSGVE